MTSFVSICCILIVALVIFSLIGVFLLAIRKKRWWLVCVGLLIVALVARLVWTSGIRSDDWVQGMIYSEGEDTIVVVVDGCEIVLEKMPWRMNDLDFDMQVAGWSTSASEISGAGMNIYVHYLSGGESEIIVNQRKLRLRKAGTEILIGSTLTPLKPDQRVRVRSKEAE